MGFFNSLTSGLSEPAQWLIDWFRGGQETDSGVAVTTESALSYPPVWYAVSKIAGHVGQLPLNLHRKLPAGGSEHADAHPVYSLLRTRPNEYQTAIAFKEQMMVHALLNGNGRAAILRQGGVPRELLPMLPECTFSCIMDGRKWHVVNCNYNTRYEHIANKGKLEQVISYDWAAKDGIYKIADNDVFHVPGLGYDGISGKSLIQVAKDSIGLGLAAQKATARSFKNGSRPGLIIKAPPGMFREDKDAKEFLDNFNAYHEGPENFGRASMTREGMDITTVSMNASDAQWIEQRLFQRQDAALLFLLESILGDDSSVSYNSLEQKNLAYLLNCLMRWLVKWEQEADFKLLGRGSRNLYTKFNTAALLRADFQTTVTTLAAGIAARMFNPNEAREKIDMNPYEGGDEFANPAITPGSAGDEEEETEDKDDNNTKAVKAHLRHLITTEANRVVFAAGKGNYSAWLDKFYRQFVTKMTESVELFGGDPKLAKQHCDESKRQLLELVSVVSVDGIAAAVEEAVASWPERAELLTDSILLVTHATD